MMSYTDVRNYIWKANLCQVDLHPGATRARICMDLGNEVAQL